VWAVTATPTTSNASYRCYLWEPYCCGITIARKLLYKYFPRYSTWPMFSTQPTSSVISWSLIARGRLLPLSCSYFPFSCSDLRSPSHLRRRPVSRDGPHRFLDQSIHRLLNYKKHLRTKAAKGWSVHNQDYSICRHKRQPQYLYQSVF